MHSNSVPTIALLCAILLWSTNAVSQESRTVRPAKISKDEVAGTIFQRDDRTATTHPDGHQTESVTTRISSDGKFSSGMYRSGKTRFEINQPYGVDEFMFFLSGSVTLTSKDGSVMTVHAGEGVTMPKEWTGIWDTEIWVIYAPDNSASE
ncbi:MAG: DUF861 domain-containing protein [Pseudomonadales bacterium]|nr:DUF861 domain-containing protein [Pseudomonadales bacterium]